MLYTVEDSSIMVGEKFGNTPYNTGIVVASDWHDSANGEWVILVARGHRHYSVRIVKEAAALPGRPNDNSEIWDVLYDETFPSIESAVNGQMTPEPYYTYRQRSEGEAAPWQAGYVDCKERE